MDAGHPLLCEHQPQESKPEPELRTQRIEGQMATQQAREHVCETIPARMTYIFSPTEGGGSLPGREGHRGWSQKLI